SHGSVLHQQQLEIHAMTSGFVREYQETWVRHAGFKNSNDLACARRRGIICCSRRWLETLAWKKEDPCDEHERRGHRRDSEGRQGNVKRRLCNDRKQRAQHGVDRNPPARRVEHRTQRDRRQNRAETEKTASDQLALGAEKMGRQNCQYRAGESESGGCPRVHSQANEQQEGGDATRLQEHLRYALKHTAET